MLSTSAVSEAETGRQEPVRRIESAVGVVA